jgi:hypothetical protein
MSKEVINQKAILPRTADIFINSPFIDLFALHLLFLSANQLIPVLTPLTVRIQDTIENKRRELKKP